MLELKSEARPQFKHQYLGEFGALWSEDGDSIDRPSFMVMSQTQENVMGVTVGKGTLLYTRLQRLLAFGWVIRYIDYKENGDLDMFFEKADPRNYGYYRLNPQLLFKITKNDEKPL